MFYDILEGKNGFLGLKKRSSKRRKIEIFSKRLVHGFWPKLAIFPCSFLWPYRPGKCVLRYSRTKKQFFGLKTRSSKSRKIEIFSKGLVDGFRPKLAIFPCFFF